MAELLHVYSSKVEKDGRYYEARAYGERRNDGTWAGWLEFVGEGDADAAFRTDRETSQPDQEALMYWASGIEPIYLDGAMSRATRRRTT